MDNNLHTLFCKLSDLKKKVADLDMKNSRKTLDIMKAEINDKMARYINIMTKVNDAQDNMNCKQNQVMYTVQDKSLLCENSVQLSHTHHDKFIYMLKSKDIFDKLLEKLQTHTSQTDDLHSIINQFKEVHSSSHNDFIESLCEFRSTKGLLNNIKELKEHDLKNNVSMSEHKSTFDSDLGCYPNDSGNLNGHEKPIPQFTSSPISLIRFDS